MVHTDPRSDLELVESANGGDASAFEALYERHRDWVVNLAYRFTGDRELALDAAQETFIYFMRKFPGFELRAKVTTFLYPVVRSTALDALRKRKRFVGPDDELLELAASVAPAREDERLAGVLGAVQGLSAAHREVVLMRFVDGMSVEEVSVALGIPAGTVKSRVHHAVRQLRGALGVEEGGPGGA